jgi:cell wall-associated NlpC family hydrolase
MLSCAGIFMFAASSVAGCGGLPDVNGHDADESIAQLENAPVADDATTKAVFAETASALAPESIEAAIAYGQAQVDISLYTGCSAGEYRMGASPATEMQFDGRVCGQSYIYGLRPGWKGFDCSGLIYKMFEYAGVYFPYTSSAEMEAVPAVPKESIQRGDLLVKPGSHVAMYLGVADGTPWALEASPKIVMEQYDIWRVAKGVMVVDATPYLNSSSYTAHRL